MRAVRLVKENLLEKNLLMRCATAPPAIACLERFYARTRRQGSGIDDRPTHFQPPGVVIWKFRYGKKIIDEIP
jgi:hypothetical protein